MLHAREIAAVVSLMRQIEPPFLRPCRDRLPSKNAGAQDNPVRRVQCHARRRGRHVGLIRAVACTAKAADLASVRRLRARYSQRCADTRKHKQDQQTSIVANTFLQLTMLSSFMYDPLPLLCTARHGVPAKQAFAYRECQPPPCSPRIAE